MGSEVHIRDFRLLDLARSGESRDFGGLHDVYRVWGSMSQGVRMLSRV